MVQIRVSGKRTSTESEQHRNFIQMMAIHFKKKGYKHICADLLGYSQSLTVSDGRGNNYIPDLTCNKNDLVGTRIILEAETCLTIGGSHTAAQWRAFFGCAGEFHVVVPKYCGNESGQQRVRARLRELLIPVNKVHIWWPQ